MGLDMYLSAKKYLSSFDSKEAEQAKQIDKILGVDTLGFDDEDRRCKEVSLEVAYWRKANAIHNWFVENCQDGIDECQETYVGRDALKELAELCRKVLADRSLAGELLPPQAGFFFGSTDLDEYYFADLEFTASRLEAILESPELAGYGFYYQSSW